MSESLLAAAFEARRQSGKGVLRQLIEALALRLGTTRLAPSPSKRAACVDRRVVEITTLQELQQRAADARRLSHPAARQQGTNHRPLAVSALNARACEQGWPADCGQPASLGPD